MSSSSTPTEPRRQAGEPKAEPSAHQQHLAGELRRLVAAQSESPEETARIAANKEVLRNESTHNEPLVAWYDEALKRFPELRGVVVQPIEPGKFGGTSRSRFAAKNETGHELLQIDNREGADEDLLREMQAYPGAIARVAALLDMNPSEITTKKLQCFVMLHELGHTLDRTRNAQTPEEYERLRAEYKTQLASLPVPGIPASRLRVPGAREQILHEDPDILTRNGVTSYEELIYLQERTYRNLPKESYADQFAAAVMNGTPFTR